MNESCWAEESWPETPEWLSNTLTVNGVVAWVKRTNRTPREDPAKAALILVGSRSSPIFMDRKTANYTEGMPLPS